MTFRDSAYPLRFDRFRFPEHLFDNVGGQFTQVVRPRASFVDRLVQRGELPEQTISGQRCTTETHGFFLWPQERVRCNFQPQAIDRSLLRALLLAWIRRGVSDRYLDFVLIRRMENSSFDRPQSVAEARERIGRNYPDGCVRFAYNELPRQCMRGDLPIFGDAILPDTSYNEVYSAILMWDDMYCGGLIPWIRTQTSRVPADGAERGISYIVRAANDWASAAQGNPGSIYGALRRDVSG